MLSEFRAKIDKIDEKIVDLLQQRFEVVKEIGVIKKHHGLETEDENREEAIVANLKSKAKNLPDGLIKDLYKIIFEFSKKVQK
jgi:chorismate mutase